MNWSHLLPGIPEKYRGARFSFWFLALVALVSTARSLAHIFAPDGGAGSIAGLEIDIPGGVNIIAIFAQWGASQLILAVFYWLAVLKYRYLVPFMLGMVCLEQVLRIGTGFLKPVMAASPPPGEVGSFLLLPIALAAFFLSLRDRTREQ